MISVVCLLLIFTATASASALPGGSLGDINDSFGYYNIRPDANLFYWLYYYNGTQGSYLDQPLVLWLQGGPGSSSTGYGNFVELGPYDYNLTYRETNWVTEASVLFVDQPVGTGYSYVTNPSAYATNNTQIADDMVLFFIQFFNNYPEFQTIPFYIFCESYGGKMTSEIGLKLDQAIKGGQVTSNFQGVALGDSWVSGIDYVLTWGQYLYQTSFVDQNGLDAINFVAEQCKQAVDEGRWLDATDLWSQTETVVQLVSAGVNFYNILLKPSETLITKVESKEFNFVNQHAKNLFLRHVAPTYGDQLSDLMNGPVRDYLGIIPDTVSWGGQSNDVFAALYIDFMKPSISIVDELLQTTNLKVVIFNGMLDLICDTPGTEQWMKQLKWEGMSAFNNATRPSFSIAGDPVVGFYKTHENLSFYWVLNAGHMIPTDQGWVALKMLDMIIKGAPPN
ncbi:Retinoid-inducible serine carboxypeptidase [Chamberlinius hualienensis]